MVGLGDWTRAVLAIGFAFALGAGAPQGDAADLAPSNAYNCEGAQGYANSFDGRRTFLWRPEWIEAIAADDSRRDDIIKEAEKALKRGPYSVTHKGQLVPGASASDYTSIGPYWWPDKRKKDGLPYTRRDGEVNPQRSGPDFDKNRLTKLGADMEALALAYHFTGEGRFAQHAALLVRTWFLAPETRMAPNMDFAQGIPGRVNGRGEGIIEASDFSTVIEGDGLIAPSGALSEKENAELRRRIAK